MKKPTILLSLTFLFLLLPVMSGCSRTAPEATLPVAKTMALDTVNTWNLSGLNADEAIDNSPNNLALQFGAQIAMDEINAEGGINNSLLAFCSDDSTDSFYLFVSDSSVDILAGPDGPLLASLPLNVNDFEVNTDHGSALQFIQKYRQMYGSDPDIYAVSAYDCVYLLKKVLEQNKAAPNTDTALLIDIFQKTVPEIHFEGLSGCEVLLGAFVEY